MIDRLEIFICLLLSKKVIAIIVFFLDFGYFQIMISLKYFIFSMLKELGVKSLIDH